MKREQFIAWAKEKIKAEYGTQHAFALHHGINQCHVSEVLRGKRNPSPVFLSALACEKVVFYLPTLKGVT